MSSRDGKARPSNRRTKENSYINLDECAAEEKEEDLGGPRKALASILPVYVRRANFANRRSPQEKIRRKIAFMSRRDHSATEYPASNMQMSQLNLRPRSTDRDEEYCQHGMRHTYSDAAVDAAAGKTADTQGFNALYDVSQEFMRLAGYTPRYTWLLSNGGATVAGAPVESRRSPWPLEKGLNVLSEEVQTDDKKMLRMKYNHEYGNNVLEGALLEDKAGQHRSMNKEQTALTQRRRARPQNFYALQKKGKEVYYTKKQLMEKRTRACDFSVLFSLVGIAITVMEAELVAVGSIFKNGHASNALKSMILVSTVVLLVFVGKYHWLTAKILLITSGADDWRVTIQFQRLVQCIIELAMCALCPLPGATEAHWQILSPKNHRSITTTKIPLDSILSVLMFLRAYLICRFVALHNKRYQDPATRSIAALNNVNVDFPFALKTMMHERPLQVLVTVAVTFWVVMSWLLTQCERHNGVPEGNHYLNSVWLVVVTFTSIGYGDLVPQTYCGRALAIATGIMGAGVSSVLIAVISKRMELTRAEKQVNQFINDSKLSLIKKNTAAQILQHTWFIYRYKKSQSGMDQHKLRIHQRKFLNAIHQFRSIKWNQRRLDEQGCDLLDLPKLQSQMQQSLSSLRRGQDTISAQIKALEREIDRVMAIHRSFM